MAVETAVDGWGALAGRQRNDTAATLNFTPSLFEAAPGQSRLLQPVWDLRLLSEAVVASPLFPVVLGVGFYFGCMLPFTLIDLFGSEWTWVRRYKIQPSRVVTWPAVRHAVALTLWNNVLYILPVSVAQYVWMPDTELPAVAPALWEFIWQQFAALVVFDAEYYAWHYLHHRIRWLYRHVHSVHHQYSSPSCWVTQYLHPYELVAVGFFTCTCPWLFGSHPMTHWSFMVASIGLSVDAHVGYDLPLSPHHWAPFWGGSVKHDMHHQRPLTNFQPFFNWFDRLFGTECPGQCAAGYRPPSLIAWDKKRRAGAAGASEADGAETLQASVSRLDKHVDDEDIVEAKRL